MRKWHLYIELKGAINRPSAAISNSKLEKFKVATNFVMQSRRNIASNIS